MSIETVGQQLQRHQVLVAVCLESALKPSLSLSPKNLYLLHDA